ncbi:MAG: ABC transporter permease [Chthoniobacterales bacterium]|nr:ABC transporter permease [Chthoniobacterales bacterium]
MISDLRYAVRMLLKAPAFALIAIAALALGIGANTAIFSVVEAVLLRPLPYPQSDRLVLLRERMRIFESGSVSYLNFLDWRAAQHTFTDLALYRRDSANLSAPGGGAAPERVNAGVMTWNTVRVLGLKPILGRDFAEKEDVPGGPKVTMISASLWQRRFGGSPKAIGQQIVVDTVPREIVGVLPNEMQLMRTAQVFISLGDLRKDKNILQRDNHPGFSALGRLKDGTTLAQAKAELDTIARSLTSRYPETNSGRSINARPLLDATVGDYRQSLNLLLAAVGCVLLIACANVANLQLARALSRGKELAVRAAMGASRWRLMRLLLVESTLLGLVGGAAGLLIAVWSIDAIHALSPQHVLRFQQTRLDVFTLVFATIIALLCGILAGVWPAWRVSRLAALAGDLNEAGSRGGSESTGRQRARSALVVTQVALALILLAGAGLTVKSFWRSQNAPLGFEPKGILAMTLSLPQARYNSSDKRRAFFAQMLERVQAVPGVELAAIGENIPFDDNEWDSSFHLTGTPPSEHGREPSAEINVVSQDYFKLMKMPLLRGRNFTAEDKPHQPHAVIIDESFARRYFPNQNPVGRHLDDNQNEDDNPVPLTIIGVVPRVRTDAPGDEFDRQALPQEYLFASQVVSSDNNLLVRAAVADPAMLAPAIVRAVQSVDPDQPVAAIATMEENIGDSLATRRLTMTLLGSFAALALILASVGLYGVMALTVTQRTREFGIRLALGAPRENVFRLALGRGLALVGIGMSLGFLGAIGAGRALTSLLYNVGSLDPVALLTALIALAVVTFLACWFPARRATRVDPIVALRYE